MTFWNFLFGSPSVAVVEAGAGAGPAAVDAEGEGPTTFWPPLRPLARVVATRGAMRICEMKGWERPNPRTGWFPLFLWKF